MKASGVVPDHVPGVSECFSPAGTGHASREAASARQSPEGAGHARREAARPDDHPKGLIGRGS